MKCNTVFRGVFFYLHLTNIAILLGVCTTSKYFRFMLFVGKIFKIFRKVIPYFECLLCNASEHDFELINRESILFFYFTFRILSYRRIGWISCC